MTCPSQLVLAVFLMNLGRASALLRLTRAAAPALSRIPVVLTFAGYLRCVITETVPLQGQNAALRADPQCGTNSVSAATPAGFHRSLTTVAHRLSQIVGVRIMAYLLPRAIMVLIAWGLTCGLIRKFSPDADPVIFFVAGASWSGAGIAYFAYLRRLKRDIDDLSRRRYSHGHSVG